MRGWLTVESGASGPLLFPLDALCFSVVIGLESSLSLSLSLDLFDLPLSDLPL